MSTCTKKKEIKKRKKKKRKEKREEKKTLRVDAQIAGEVPCMERSQTFSLGLPNFQDL